MRRSKTILVSPCHPELPVYAKGLCKACYMRELRQMPVYNVRRMNRKWWSLNVKYMTHLDGLAYMTVEHLHTMIADQNGICKCCGRENDKDSNGIPMELHLNWNLNTGIVRGLVCNKCHAVLNRKLNSLTYPDDPDFIRASAKPNRDQYEYYFKIADFAETVLMPK